MKKQEEKENAGQLIPVFGVVYNINQPEELQKAIDQAEKEKAQAKEYFEQSRRYLMKCSGLVNSLKTRVYYAGKEVCNG